MGYKHVFVDSDVLLDLLLNRNPFYIYTQFLMFENERERIKLYTSTLVIANINYILAKKIGASAAKESLKELIKLIKILPFEIDAINIALISPIVDFEDAIQSFIAEKNKCEAIITRNIKDYKQATIPVLTAEQFLRTL
jgi:predicted nucleic acid-binding protein